MTFLRQIQLLLERTYQPIGLNLETCLVGHQRYMELNLRAGEMALQMSHDGKTFLRVSEGHLYLAIYYNPSVITALEHDFPLKTLNSNNIHPLIVFIEEINHAIHAALLFLENRLQMDAESMLCNLELQAKVDTYLAIKLIGSKILGKRCRFTRKQSAWLKKCLFGMESFEYPNKTLGRRYRKANQLGLRYVQYLDTLEAGKRVACIRKFRSLSFSQKRAEIIKLTPPS